VGPGGTTRSDTRTTRIPTGVVATVVAVALGFGCGVSAELGGYYDLAVWGWIGLVLLVVVVGVLVGAGLPRSSPFLIALGGLVASWLWCLLSSTWAESADQAILASNRWLLYAAFLVVAGALSRRRSGAAGLVAGIALGGVFTLVHLVVDLLSADAPSLFRDGRLVEPVGYPNGVGTYLLIGVVWPAVALAERARPLVLSALGAGAATLAACLILLTQSRGVALAALVSIVAAMVLLPGRVVRGWLLVLVGAGVGAAAPTMFDVFGSARDAGTIHDSVWIALVAAASVTAAWAGALAAARALLSTPSSLRTAGGVGLGVLCLAGVVLLIAFSGRIADEVSRQYDVFVHPSGQTAAATASTSHLVSGSGYRYDYWRVAWREFRAHPLDGVGAGNYDVFYFRERSTTEDVRQPHSLELQAASETGVIGVLALLVYLAGVYLGAFRRRSDARASSVGRVLCVAALGAFTGWLVDTSVDWMALIPGVTGIALCGAAVLTVRDTAGNSTARLRWWALVPALVLVALGALFLGRQTLAERARLDGEAVLASNPREAIDDARRALDYNPDSVPALYLEAAAYARLGNAERSQAALLFAGDREPSDWVTWALLGDLMVRQRRFAAAQTYYRRASMLNPRYPPLRMLAADPRRATQLER
jgi:O-antigen ligase